MADNFGLKIGVEGEKEFKKALSDINSQFKVLGSEMKLSGWSVYGRPPYWTEAEVAEMQGAKPVAEQQQGFLFTRVLKSGMRGEDVCELKRLLAAAGFGGLTPGNKNYYNKTKNTVKAFQKANGLVPDGKAGPLTIAALGGVWKTE